MAEHSMTEHVASDRQRLILTQMSQGRSLCFTEDGEDCFLTGTPRRWLGPENDQDVQAMIKAGWIANDPDADHWTADNSYEIADAGRRALGEDASRKEG
jgi:hypothetical protein